MEEMSRYRIRILSLSVRVYGRVMQLWLHNAMGRKEYAAPLCSVSLVCKQGNILDVLTTIETATKTGTHMSLTVQAAQYH